ncbi:MAG: hypothetical protein IJ158_09505 [Treponema sp.]|nr:hypothetical protein [Treponema sp.]
MRKNDKILAYVTAAEIALAASSFAVRKLKRRKRNAVTLTPEKINEVYQVCKDGKDGKSRRKK